MWLLITGKLIQWDKLWVTADCVSEANAYLSWNNSSSLYTEHDY